VPQVEGRCPHTLDPWVRLEYRQGSWRSLLWTMARAQWLAWRHCREHGRYWPLVPVVMRPGHTVRDHHWCAIDHDWEAVYCATHGFLTRPREGRGGRAFSGDAPAASAGVCTRPSPHECTVNGPCNGWPRSFAGVQGAA
jgi:hypothetical protein